MPEIFDGRPFSADFALKNHLIDEIGTFYDVLDYLLGKAGVEEKDIKLQQNVEKKGLLSKLFSLEVDNSLVNVLADYLIGRIAVRKAYRGQSMGKRIVEMVIQHIKDKGASKISLSAQVQAKGFYEALGFRAKGDVYLDEYCPHVHMEKVL